MSDARLRELERQAATGDPEAQAALRLARIRAGLESLPTTSYPVVEMSLTSLEKKVKTWAGRAKKLGAIPMTLHSGKPYWHRDETSGLRVRLVDVTLIGDAPCLGDWELIARLQHKKEGTLIQIAPGADAGFSERELERYRLARPRCSQCKLRRKRNDTFIVRHRPCKGAGCDDCQNLVADGTIDEHGYAQVGKTCVNEFTGADPKVVLYAFNVEKGLQAAIAKAGTLDDTVKADWGLETAHYLTHCCAAARIQNRYTRWNANRTWETTEACLRRNQNTQTCACQTEDRERAERILTDAREHLINRIQDETKPLNDFEHNLAVELAEGAVSRRNAGLAGSAIRWHERWLLTEDTKRPLATRIRETLAQAKVESVAGSAQIALSAEALLGILDNPTLLDALRGLRQPTLATETGDHLGTPGQSGTWDLQVTRTNRFDGRNGLTTAINLVDREGRRAVWFASGDHTGLNRSAWYTITGQVGKHGVDTYRNRNTPLTTLRTCTITSNTHQAA